MRLLWLSRNRCPSPAIAGPRAMQPLIFHSLQVPFQWPSHRHFTSEQTGSKQTSTTAQQRSLQSTLKVRACFQQATILSTLCHNALLNAGGTGEMSWLSSERKKGVGGPPSTQSSPQRSSSRLSTSEAAILHGPLSRDQQQADSAKHMVSEERRAYLGGFVAPAPESAMGGSPSAGAFDAGTSAFRLLLPLCRRLLEVPNPVPDDCRENTIRSKPAALACPTLLASQRPLSNVYKHCLRNCISLSIGMSPNTAYIKSTYRYEGHHWHH